MILSQQLADDVRPRLHLLQAALAASGHLAGRGLILEGRELTTHDDAGDPDELSPAAQAFVAEYVTPPAPPTPNYGTDDIPAELLATAVSNLRASLALTAAERAQAVNWVPAFALVIRVVLFILRRMVP